VLRKLNLQTYLMIDCMRKIFIGPVDVCENLLLFKNVPVFMTSRVKLLHYLCYRWCMTILNFKSVFCDHSFYGSKTVFLSFYLSLFIIFNSCLTLFCSRPFTSKNTCYMPTDQTYATTQIYDMQWQTVWKLLWVNINSQVTICFSVSLSKTLNPTCFSPPKRINE
jgi:hypothetical protein